MARDWLQHQDLFLFFIFLFFFSANTTFGAWLIRQTLFASKRANVGMCRLQAWHPYKGAHAYSKIKGTINFMLAMVDKVYNFRQFHCTSPFSCLVSFENLNVLRSKWSLVPTSQRKKRMINIRSSRTPWQPSDQPWTWLLLRWNGVSIYMLDNVGSISSDDPSCMT